MFFESAIKGALGKVRYETLYMRSGFSTAVMKRWAQARRKKRAMRTRGDAKANANEGGGTAVTRGGCFLGGTYLVQYDAISGPNSPGHVATIFSDFSDLEEAPRADRNLYISAGQRRQCNFWESRRETNKSTSGVFCLMPCGSLAYCTCRCNNTKVVHRRSHPPHLDERLSEKPSPKSGNLPRLGKVRSAEYSWVLVCCSCQRVPGGCGLGGGACRSRLADARVGVSSGCGYTAVGM